MKARPAEVDAILAPPVLSPVRLYLQLNEIDRRKAEALSQTLADPVIRTRAMKTIRGLISSVTIHETEGSVRAALDGAISAVVGRAKNAKSFMDSVSAILVAGGRIT